VVELRSLFVACVLAACSSSSTPDASPSPDAGTPADDGGVVDPGDSGSSVDGGGGEAGATTIVRIAATNTTSGNQSTYEPAESLRLFQGLHPDIVLLQEFKYQTDTDPEIRAFVDTAFGASYSYYREATVTTGDIPNGIVSRYPIVESGSWDDPRVDNRGFAWAKIAIPDVPHPLWAVSMHLLTTSGVDRNGEAMALVAKINEVVPAGDYLVIGGDFNTDRRDESCITTLSQVVVTADPYPDDGAGNENTNAPRTKAYDWLLADSDLNAHATPLVIGARSFAAGLVFDSRIYQPLTDVAPIQMADSDAVNMQHMPVVRAFAIPH